MLKYLNVLRFFKKIIVFLIADFTKKKPSMYHFDFLLFKLKFQYIATSLFVMFAALNIEDGNLGDRKLNMIIFLISGHIM